MEDNSDKINFDGVVIGNVGIDTNVYFHQPEVNFNNESNFTENLDYIGQAGGYSARGYAKLGKNTAFIGSVGNDHNGQMIRDTFFKDGIDTSAMFTDPTGTARSINFMYPDGRRKNFYDGKNHMNIEPDIDLCRTVIQNSRMAHFHIPNWARKLLPIAKQAGITIACDLQDIISANDEYRLDFIRYTDILFFSTVNHESLEPLFHEFQKINPGVIAIAGMGARGCALCATKKAQYFPAIDMEEPVIDTNGAGDSLAVGFLSSYILDGYSIEDSVLRGQIAARHCCTLKANSDQLISGSELNRIYHQIKKEQRL